MSELFECSSFISGGNGSSGECNNCGIQNYDFGYTAENGPLSWANCYADVSGCYQSPINIERKLTAKINAEPLKWSGFKALPCSMTMFNDGTAGNFLFFLLFVDYIWFIYLFFCKLWYAQRSQTARHRASREVHSSLPMTFTRWSSIGDLRTRREASTPSTTSGMYLV